MLNIQYNNILYTHAHLLLSSSDVIALILFILSAFHYIQKMNHLEMDWKTHSFHSMVQLHSMPHMSARVQCTCSTLHTIYKSYQHIFHILYAMQMIYV